jgi:formate hydrogenlyase subunit 6/NADH:ubiquinone oxidoreductase subunit I
MDRIEHSVIDSLLQALQSRGYVTIGPTARNGAIVCDEIHSASDLPIGITDEQSPATYRLKSGNNHLSFGYVLSPVSWKRFLVPPVLTLFKAVKTSDGFRITNETSAPDTPPQPRKLAFIGVRPCDLQALTLLDKVFLGDRYTDPYYKAQREQLFLIVVNCTKAGGTCFCGSMGTGPTAKAGYDIALTEMDRKEGAFFLIDSGSEKGAEVMRELDRRKAAPEEILAADEASVRTRASMGRTLETDHLKEILADNPEHPRWDVVAGRCLTCANCTMVCPTCFCSTVEDVTDLTGKNVERVRKWDSCFTMDFSYIHGGSVRATPKSRYRQWVTHKLSSWVDQYGDFGCVGCGRCITWCPVGIDITEEACAIRENHQTVLPHP